MKLKYTISTLLGVTHVIPVVEVNQLILLTLLTLLTLPDSKVCFCKSYLTQ
jgi:hypothetical protein